MTVIRVSDDFNRVDGDLDLSDLWTQINGTTGIVEIVGNSVRNNSDASATNHILRYEIPPQSLSMEVSANVSTNSGTSFRAAGPVACMGDDDTGYFLRVNPNSSNYNLEKYISGALQFGVNIAISPSPGHAMKIRVAHSGNHATVYAFIDTGSGYPEVPDATLEDTDPLMYKDWGLYFRSNVSGEYVALDVFIAKDFAEDTSTLGPAFIKKPWTRQPPVDTPIDWTHPLTKNLKWLYMPGVSTKNLADYKYAELSVATPVQGGVAGRLGRYAQYQSPNTAASMQYKGPTASGLSDTHSIAAVANSTAWNGDLTIFSFSPDSVQSQDRVELRVSNPNLLLYDVNGFGGDGGSNTNVDVSADTTPWFGMVGASDGVFNERYFYVEAITDQGTPLTVYPSASDSTDVGSISTENIGVGAKSGPFSLLTSLPGQVAIVAAWDNRALTEEEARSWIDNPYQIFEPQKTFVLSKPNALNQRLVRF